MKGGQRETGSCLRCGRCCMWISMVINQEIEPETAVYLDAHGCRRRGNKLLIPSRCQHLKGEAPPYSCDLHDTVLKPTICQVYPGEGGGSFTVFNECGFRRGASPVPPDEPVLRKHRRLRK